jgi:tetratricopeptide (TPR) repeat protein
MVRYRSMFVVLCLLPISLFAADLGAAATPYNAQRFEGLGDHRRSITTSSPDAQAFFDQGLVLYFGFNHEEAIRSLEAALELDPGCAMAQWGIGMSAGPNINNPEMEEAASKLAWESAQAALALLDEESPVERALVEALAVRYTWPAPEDRSELNQKYADAMRKVWAAHGDDADVGAWTAEALMNLRPWDLWTSEGKPNPGTDEIMTILETVLEIEPNHPGACHFYIHTMEASPFPEKALPAANRLRTLVPAAGHLVHMPGHIDIRLGNYESAAQANLNAIEADRRYVELTGGAQGFYTIYRAHNYHFLAYAAMFDGRREMALKAAQEMVDQVPMELVLAYPDFLDAFMAVPVHVLVRFGLWEQLLELPRPREELQASTAFWHYGRTVAFSALGRVEEGAREFAALEAAIETVPESRLMGNNTVDKLTAIAHRMAEGELRYRQGEHERAFELLREAVQRDDALRYDEPWGWMQPVRHALGALLLEQGQLAEAEAVYREDLELHPGNGWALHGLGEALRRQGKSAEATRCSQDFDRAWLRADINISGSCYCRRGTTKG